MGTVFVLLLIFVLGLTITSLVFSRRAKQDNYYRIRIPAGGDVQGFIDAALRELPSGWSVVGAKKSHYAALAEWDAGDEGGNLFDIATGSGSLGSLYVISAEMGVVGKDEYGRPTQYSYDEVPPQTEYEGHVWVSYAARGQGRMWPLPASLKIIKARAFLEERLSAEVPGSPA